MAASHRPALTFARIGFLTNALGTSATHETHVLLEVLR